MDIQEDVRSTTVDQRKSKKKPHGNLRDQRFRRKYRKRGMNEEQIEKLLQTKKKIERKKNCPRTTSVEVNQTTTYDESTRNNNQSIQRQSQIKLHKRKRDISLQELNQHTTSISKSASSISIQQPIQKKMRNKNKTSSIMSTIQAELTSIINRNYR